MRLARLIVEYTFSRGYAKNPFFGGDGTDLCDFEPYLLQALLESIFRG